MSGNENKKILKSSLKMSLVTTISRFLGLFRDQIQAFLLGTSFVADAFAIGFILPNLLRRLFAEGNMVVSFIPVFIEVKKEDGEEEAKLFFRSVFSILFLVMIFIVLIGIIVSPFLVRLLYTSADNNIEAVNLASNLSRIMFPYLFFISLAALMQGILNVHNSYSISAASPILFNIVIISVSLIFYFFFKNTFDSIAYVFAFAVLLGGFVQFIYQIPFVARLGFSFKPLLNFKSKYVRKMIYLFIPGIFGASIYQINLLVSTAFAGSIGEGRVAALTFATRLNEFTLGIFAVSISTVMLPTLSRLIAENNIEEAKKSLSYSIRLIALITIPASLGLMILGREIISMLFEYGKFSSESSNLVYNALFYLSISLFFVAGYRIIVQSFYAMKDMKTPVYVALFAFFINLIFNILCVYYFKFDIKGIAISSVVANIFSFFILFFILKKKMKTHSILDKKLELIKTIFSSFIMCIFVLIIKKYLFNFEFLSIAKLDLILKIIIIIFSSIFIYAMANIILKNKDFSSLFDIFISKIKPKV